MIRVFPRSVRHEDRIKRFDPAVLESGLSEELRVLRDVLDEILTELQWSN